MGCQQTTLGERLELALDILHLSQTRASTLTGVPQGTISHLVRNQVRTYKNSRALADGLNLNHDWLVYGRGGILNPDAHYVPIIHEYFRLRLFLSEFFLENSTRFLITEFNYGPDAFATLLDNNVLICSSISKLQKDEKQFQYSLRWTEENKDLTNEPEQISNAFLIHEKREYATLPDIFVPADKA